MKTFKRVAALILTFVMVLGMFPVIGYHEAHAVKSPVGELTSLTNTRKFYYAYYGLTPQEAYQKALDEGHTVGVAWDKDYLTFVYEKPNYDYAKLCLNDLAEGGNRFVAPSEVTYGSKVLHVAKFAFSNLGVEINNFNEIYGSGFRLFAYNDAESSMLGTIWGTNTYIRLVSRDVVYQSSQVTEITSSQTIKANMSRPLSIQQNSITVIDLDMTINQLPSDTRDYTDSTNGYKKVGAACNNASGRPGKAFDGLTVWFSDAGARVNYRGTFGFGINKDSAGNLYLYVANHDTFAQFPFSSKVKGAAGTLGTESVDVKVRMELVYKMDATTMTSGKQKGQTVGRFFVNDQWVADVGVTGYGEQRDGLDIYSAGFSITQNQLVIEAYDPNNLGIDIDLHSYSVSQLVRNANSVEALHAEEFLGANASVDNVTSPLNLSTVGILKGQELEWFNLSNINENGTVVCSKDMTASASVRVKGDTTYSKTFQFKVGAGAHIPGTPAACGASTCTVCGAVTSEATGEHSYSSVVDEKFLKSPATPASKAVYWKSCACGVASTNPADTFQHGDVTDFTLGDWDLHIGEIKDGIVVDGKPDEDFKYHGKMVNNVGEVLNFGMGWNARYLYLSYPLSTGDLPLNKLIINDVPVIVAPANQISDTHVEIKIPLADLGITAGYNQKYTIKMIAGEYYCAGEFVLTHGAGKLLTKDGAAATLYGTSAIPNAPAGTSTSYVSKVNGTYSFRFQETANDVSADAPILYFSGLDNLEVGTVPTVLDFTVIPTNLPNHVMNAGVNQRSWVNCLKVTLTDGQNAGKFPAGTTGGNLNKDLKAGLVVGVAKCKADSDSQAYIYLLVNTQLTATDDSTTKGTTYFNTGIPATSADALDIRVVYDNGNAVLDGYATSTPAPAQFYVNGLFVGQLDNARTFAIGNSNAGALYFSMHSNQITDVTVEDMKVAYAPAYSAYCFHEYTNEVKDAQYIKDKATPVSYAVYYKSCDCGHFDPAKSGTFIGTEYSDVYDDFGDLYIYENVDGIVLDGAADAGFKFHGTMKNSTTTLPFGMAWNGEYLYLVYKGTAVPDHLKIDSKVITIVDANKAIGEYVEIRIPMADAGIAVSKYNQSHWIEIKVGNVVYGGHIRLSQALGGTVNNAAGVPLTPSIPKVENIPENTATEVTKDASGIYTFRFAKNQDKIASIALSYFSGVGQISSNATKPTILDFTFTPTNMPYSTAYEINAGSGAWGEYAQICITDEGNDDYFPAGSAGEGFAMKSGIYMGIIRDTDNYKLLVMVNKSTEPTVRKLGTQVIDTKIPSTSTAPMDWRIFYQNTSSVVNSYTDYEKIPATIYLNGELLAELEDVRTFSVGTGGKNHLGMYMQTQSGYALDKKKAYDVTIGDVRLANVETCYHRFTEEIVADKYLKSSATPVSVAVYYKSCECGHASETETFEYGTVSSVFPDYATIYIPENLNGITMDGKLDSVIKLHGAMSNKDGATKKFGAVWNKEYLYLTIEGTKLPATLIINGKTLDVSTLTTAVSTCVEIKIPMADLDIEVTTYNQSHDFDIIVDGYLYGGKLALSYSLDGVITNASGSPLAPYIPADDKIPEKTITKVTKDGSGRYTFRFAKTQAKLPSIALSYFSGAKQSDSTTGKNTVVDFTLIPTNMPYSNGYQTTSGSGAWGEYLQICITDETNEDTFPAGAPVNGGAMKTGVYMGVVRDSNSYKLLVQLNKSTDPGVRVLGTQVFDTKIPSTSTAPMDLRIVYTNKDAYVKSYTDYNDIPAQVYVNGELLCDLPNIRTFSVGTGGKNHVGIYMRSQSGIATSDLQAYDVTVANLSIKNIDACYHRFVNEVVDAKYLKDAATPVSKAVYYKSCECGVASEDPDDTFEHGGFSSEYPNLGKIYAGYLKNEVSLDGKITEKDFFINGAMTGKGGSSIPFGVTWTNKFVYFAVKKPVSGNMLLKFGDKTITIPAANMFNGTGDYMEFKIPVADVGFDGKTFGKQANVVLHIGDYFWSGELVYFYPVYTKAPTTAGGKATASPGDGTTRPANTITAVTKNANGTYSFRVARTVNGVNAIAAGYANVDQMLSGRKAVIVDYTFIPTKLTEHVKDESANRSKWGQAVSLYVTDETNESVFPEGTLCAGKTLQTGLLLGTAYVDGTIQFFMQVNKSTDPTVLKSGTIYYDTGIPASSKEPISVKVYFDISQKTVLNSYTDTTKAPTKVLINGKIAFDLEDGRAFSIGSGSKTQTLIAFTKGSNVTTEQLTAAEFSIENMSVTYAQSDIFDTSVDEYIAPEEEAPETGDNTPLKWYIAAIVICLVGMVALAVPVLRKKKI